MSINRKICREVGKHIFYCLSKVSHSLVDFLVDRGANSDVAGNDVRVRAKHPYRTLDIRRIDNHGIASIHLVTTGDVTLTTSD